MIIRCLSSRSCRHTFRPLLRVVSRFASSSGGVSPAQLVQAMKQYQIRRGYLVRHPDTGEVIVSDDRLREAVTNVFSTVQATNYGGVYWQVGDKSNALLVVAVDHAARGPALGGVRIISLPPVDTPQSAGTVASLFLLALHGAKGSSIRNALADLPFGGGRAFIVPTSAELLDLPSDSSREALFLDFGSFVSSLSGLFVAAPDSSTTSSDMACLEAVTRHVVGVSPVRGGWTNSAVETASGLLAAVEAALPLSRASSKYQPAPDGQFPYGTLRFGIQGLGRVGRAVLDLILNRGCSWSVCSELSGPVVESLRQRHSRDDRVSILRQAKRDASFLFQSEVDVLLICSESGVLNARSIQQLHRSVAVVASSVDRPTAVPKRDDAALAARGAILVPDVLTTRMRYVTAAVDAIGVLPANVDPLITRHYSPDYRFSIPRLSEEMVTLGNALQKPPSSLMQQVANERITTPNPIYGDRGELITRVLLDTRSVDMNWLDAA